MYFETSPNRLSIYIMVYEIYLRKVDPENAWKVLFWHFSGKLVWNASYVLKRLEAPEVRGRGGSLKQEKEKSWSFQKSSTGFSIICNFCSIFFGCDESVCPLYMLTIYIWSTQKWPLRQSMCTHVAHTLHFPRKQNFWWKNVPDLSTLCAVWVHILCLYTFF